MQRRALPIALLILGLLLGWLWLLERAPAPTPAPPTATALWSPFEPADVLAITLRDKGDVGARLERTDTGWLATLPDDGRPRRGNAVLADAAASALAGVTSTRTLPGAPLDYGLGDGALAVTVELPGGARTLVIGGPLTVGHGHYARIEGAPAVHVVGSAPLLVLLRDPLEFRDNRLLPLAPDQILHIASELTDPPLHLDRRERSWLLDPGPGMRAGEDAVAALLDDLVGIEARSWAPSDGRLDGPNIQLTTADGLVTVELGPLPSGSGLPTTVRARVSGTLPLPDDADQIATIPTAGLAALLQPEDAWRSDAIVELNPWQVTAFTWSAQGTDWAFELGPEGWLGPPEGGARVALTREHVSGFLQRVDGLRGSGWLPADDAPLGLVETAHLTGAHADGTSFGLTLLRGPAHDYARATGEAGLREVDAEPTELLGQLRALPEAW